MVRHKVKAPEFPPIAVSSEPPFNVTIRVYQLKKPSLDRSYKVPPLRKV